MWIKITEKAFYVLDDKGDVVKEFGPTMVLKSGELVFSGEAIAQQIRLFNIGNVVVDFDPADTEPAGRAAPVPPKKEGVLQGLKVFLDVGHGYHNGVGHDPGAKGNGLEEWNLNKMQAARIAETLRARGAEVSIGLYSDPGGPRLKLGQKGARAAGHQIFVSLHHNAFNGEAQGHEVLVHTNAANEDESLAKAINARLDEKLSIANRGVKRQGLGVLSGVPPSVNAACLTETCFIDGPGSISMLSGLGADAIAQGIADYALSAKLV